jgi:hypothetical protein
MLVVKVATFSNRVLKGLRDKVKEKDELIETLQETVGSALFVHPSLFYETSESDQ